jgi:putative solute:sodium symporter small subunit
MGDQPVRKFHPVYLWIAVPFVALLWVPIFNRVEPTLFGIPFFYWYQALGTLLGAACIVPVYLHVQKQRKARAARGGDDSQSTKTNGNGAHI